MSNIKIDRFEKKEVKPRTHNQQIIIENNTAILIKDHQNDNIVSLVQLTNNIEKNKELADRIINTIEDYILEQENEPQNQH